jgi:hypothetical protein
LACGYHLAAFDKKVVFETDPYTVSMVIKLKSRQVQLAFETHTMERNFWGHWDDHNTIKNFVRMHQVELLIGKGVDTPTKVLSYTTPDCTYSEETLPLAKCDSIAPLSRSKSSEYSREPVKDMIQSFSSDMTSAKMKGLVVRVVQQLEDEIATNTDSAFMVSTADCKSAIPLNVPMCTAHNTTLKYISTCTQEQLHAVLNTRIVELCVARYSDWKNDQEAAAKNHAADLVACATNMAANFAYAKVIQDKVDCFNIEYKY